MAVISPPSVAQALRRAAVRATLAPSVHNTQPWRFVLGADALQVHADFSRRLTVLDPTGRQLLISCGCAVFNARASLLASGYEPSVQRLPDPSRPTLVAQLRISGRRSGPESPVAALDASTEARRTNRRRFTDDPVPEEVIDSLVAAAETEGAMLTAVRRLEDRVALAVLNQRADRHQNADPAYRAELRAWTTEDPTREDGVPALAVPHGGAGAHDDLPIRDFDTRGAGALPTETHSSMTHCLLLLGTAQDDAASWARAGEALERVLLDVTRHGYAAGPLTQAIEIPHTREALRRELRLTMHPHVLLRVGRAEPTPAPRRRRLVDMLGGAT